MFILFLLVNNGVEEIRFDDDIGDNIGENRKLK